MNWPQSSYSNANGQTSSIFSGQQSSSSSSTGAGGGFGTPGQQQQQQQHQHGNFQQNQQNNNNGFGTPLNSGIYGGGGANGGFQSSGPSTFQQHTFSTSSPQQQHHHQSQQQHPQQPYQHQHQHQQHGMLSYQSPMNSSSSGNNQYGANAGGYQSQQQTNTFGGGAGGYGQYNQNMSGQYGSSAGAYSSSPQVISSHSDNSGLTSAPVGRYLPGYLTASSFSGSPRQNSSNATQHDGRLSPEQQHRDTTGSFGAGSSRLFGSSTSSAGTAGRESPSRSPKTSLMSSSAYGSSRSLALTPASTSRTRRTSNNLIRSSEGDYMEEDAPPVDTLDEFDNDAGVPYVASPPPQQHQQFPSASQVTATAGNASPSKRRDVALPNGSGTSQSNTGSSLQVNGQISSGGSNLYKLVVFGYPPNLQSSVLQEFASIAPLAYNSLQIQASARSASASGNTPPTGTNWFTIAYDNEWAALRALKKSGDVIAGDIMIAVKWADDSKQPEAASVSQEIATSQNAGNNSNLVRSNTTSNLGTPATVLPASQAFLPKPNANSTAMRKSATMNKINDMGKLDASIFKQPEQVQQKQGTGVVGTLTNLIFGF